MSTLDYILIALLVVAGHRAIGYIVRHKGGCCGDCSKCSSSCDSCKKEKQNDETNQ